MRRHGFKARVRHMEEIRAARGRALLAETVIQRSMAEARNKRRLLEIDLMGLSSDAGSWIYTNTMTDCAPPLTAEKMRENIQAMMRRP